MTQQQIKFGFGQIRNATPKVASWIFRIILYTASAANLVLATVDEIPAPTKILIAKYSLYAVTFVHGLTKMFGLEEQKQPSFFKRQ